jgi:dihydrofolate synthase / folylpolyglutamate synthase
VNSAEEADPRYRETLRQLSSRGRFGIRLGLSRVRALLYRLGEPQRDLPGVLIGGTNGKGSVQALVAAALLEAGYRVGQTPKPHLVSYRERIQVGGSPISIADFSGLLERVLAEATALERRHGAPTEFEVLTAAAFYWFAQSAVELGVVEVGLGGRLDATNVWQGGLSAITNVALDHTEHLGGTIVEIAREKAQIIKRGDERALTGAEGVALKVIAARAGRVRVPLRAVSPLRVLSMDREGLQLADEGGRPLKVGLLGRHQAANAALALAVLQAFDESGLAHVSPEQVRRAFASARWPGRLELLSLGADLSAQDAPRVAPDPQKPDLLLDGAHNPHGTAALAAAFDELRPMLSGGRPTLLIGVLRERDIAALLAPLVASSGLHDAHVITTNVPDTRRSLAAAELAAAWNRNAAAWNRNAAAVERRRLPARSVDAATMALAEAAESARREAGPLLICGSLYLVGAMRGHLTR